MRITVLANRDVASNLALNLLREELCRHEVVLFLSERVGKASAERPQELVDLRFLEQQLFNGALFPLLDRAAGPTGAGLRTFQQLGAEWGGTVETLNAINSPEGLARLRATRPELVVSIRYGTILKQPAIDVPPLGVLNLHSGLLPAYRGVMATFRALLAGEREVGCTLHFIRDASIDTGPVIATATLPVQPAKSFLWHVLALYPVGCPLIADAIRRLERGERLAEVAQPGGGHYFSYPTAEDFAAFRRLGFKLFDGAEMAELLGRYVDAGSEVP